MGRRRGRRDRCRPAPLRGYASLQAGVPALDGIDIYLKDESTHPTGSLKHRLARSLFLYALCNGRIRQDTSVVEASSGSTAVSEAYFAEMIGVPFYRRDAAHHSAEKIAADRALWRRCHLIDDGRAIYARRPRSRAPRRPLHRPVHLRRAGNGLARQQQHRRIDLRADAAGARIRCPSWIVMSAGTGGTSATIGRYLRYRQLCDAAVRRRCRALRLLRRLSCRRRGTHVRSRLADRGRRPAERRTVVRSRRRRPHGEGARRRLDRRDEGALAPARPPCRRLDRHQFFRSVPARRARCGGTARPDRW